MGACDEIGTRRELQTWLDTTWIIAWLRDGGSRRLIVRGRASWSFETQAHRVLVKRDRTPTRDALFAQAGVLSAGSQKA